MRMVAVKNVIHPVLFVIRQVIFQRMRAPPAPLSWQNKNISAMKAIAPTAGRQSQLTDETLICLALSGQQEAYTMLVHRHERLLRFVLRRYLTDEDTIREVVQDAFVRAFGALPGFRGDSKFSTWLTRIAISQAMNRLRSKRHAAWDALEGTRLQREADEYSHEKALEKRETSQLLRRVIRQLGPNDATALELFYFREQSIEEIGQITGWTASNIKSRLSRARQRLQDALCREGLHAESFA